MTHLRPAIVLLMGMTLITGVLYPGIVTGLAQVIFPGRANGSIMSENGKAVGSSLIGQPFSGPGYFWSRPSATSPAAYNGAASTGSNLGPTNPAFIDSVKERVKRLQGADPGNHQPVPADLVTASASGLDPHITVAAARYQASRVARERGISEQTVLALIDRSTDGRGLGLLGEPGVNVLRLNLALNALSIH